MVPCSVVELRQYTLHPGRRDELVSLFERALVQGQEEAGIHVLGQFEDVARPDRFVWFRGFPSMSKRREALSRFYGGPVWHAHREAANATMAEWNDVLLLRPVQPTRGFPRRRAAAKRQTGTSRVLVRILHRAPGADDLVTFFRERVHPTEGRFIDLRPAVRFSARPEPTLGLPPQLGEHNSEVARELGLADADPPAAGRPDEPGAE